MSRLKTTKEFVADSKQIFKHLFDYSKVTYKGAHIEVELICKIHGSFFKKPHPHLSQKSGCPACSRNKLSKLYSLGIKEFVSRANAKHNNYYDYSAVHYVNSGTKVNIICPAHGKFWQTPGHHLRGHKCNKCAREAMQRNFDYIPNPNTDAILYCLKDKSSGLVKVGVTKHGLQRRYGKRLSEFVIIKIIALKETEAYKVEAYILKKYIKYKVYNHNWVGNGATEFLNITPDIFTL